MLTVFYEKLQLVLEYILPLSLRSLWALFGFRFSIRIYLKDHFQGDVYSLIFVMQLNKYNTKYNVQF